MIEPSVDESVPEFQLGVKPVGLAQLEIIMMKSNAESETKTVFTITP